MPVGGCIPIGTCTARPDRTRICDCSGASSNSKVATVQVLNYAGIGADATVTCGVFDDDTGVIECTDVIDDSGRDNVCDAVVCENAEWVNRSKNVSIRVTGKNRLRTELFSVKMAAFPSRLKAEKVKWYHPR